ncbi:Ankyrin repeat, PH and SEC7 domain containing protein secG [Mizuhopecten yessoensis]|uniref:Ankyrin repeat, PH and SEC7 domain containing protein secG n=1 Tax=Mizuhopecten yessoensis TaxID=6573 RepID=A0A210PEI8_MIZYE|nr:Ankyrin repeat, PH and SEC7 domain containing protein secG [Mizuhopecten yessoensis]
MCSRVIERTRGVERDDDEESVYMYSSRPTTPGDRKGLLVRFQLVSRTQPCVAHHYMSVNLNTKLSELRRPVNTHFKAHFDGGFIFLCKTKEIIKARERQLTIFDILPKLPNISLSDSAIRGGSRKKLPSDSFLYPGVQYKELSYDDDGTRHLVMCACVVFLFERSKVSHWPPDKLQEELSAGMLEGFSFIPSDIMSWKEKLVESRATTIHGYAACNQKKELETAIHQLPEFAYVQNIRDQRGAVPLHYAAENGHLEICEILVAAIGRDLIYQQDVNQKTPLHCALYRRKMKTSVYLLQLNSDLVRPDIHGNTCIDLVLQQSSKDFDFIISKLQIDCVDDVLKYHLARFVMKKGDKKLSKKLTERVAPCADDKLGEDLLHIAADMGDKEIVEHLILNTFDLSKRDIKDYLPFHRACAKGNKEIASLLFYPDMKDSDICKGVTLAVKQKCYAICAEIRAKKPSLVLDESSVCIITQHLDTILSKVSKERKTRDKELKDWENILKNVIPLLQKEEGVLETYVFDCARHNLPDALILLKSLGVSFNDRDFTGRSPLHEAAERDSCKAINILLKGKANPNAVDWRGGSPLHYACAKGHLQSVTLLMSLGKKIEAENQNASGRTPLLEAAYSRKFEVVQYLLSNHSKIINIRATDSCGQSILHYLVGIPDKMVDLVLAKYSSVEKTDTGKCFKRTLWTDSVKHSAWSRHITASRFRASTFFEKVGEMYYTDSKTGEQMKGPFNNGLNVASWNSRTDDESIENLKHGKSPKKEMNECTRCRDFVGKLSTYRGPHRCTLAGIRQHEGEGAIRKTVQRAFKHHFVFQQEVLSPVFNAAKTGNVMLVKKLLKFDPAYMNERDNFGRSLIELAIDQGFVKLVQTLSDLQPSQPNPGLVYRVLMQKKKTKSDNTRKALLSSLIAKGHFVDKRLETGKVTHDGCTIRKGKFCHRQCYLKGYTPLEVVVRNNDEDLFKLVLDKSSGKHKAIPLLLAAYKGHHAMLEIIKKKTYSQKKDKNEEDDEDDDDKEEEEIDERVLLDITCRSPHITVDLIKVISKLYPEMLEQNTEGFLTDHPRRRRYLLFDIPKQSFPESTSLGKLLSLVYDRKTRILSKSKIEDNACQLIDEGINLGKIFHNTHSSRRKDNTFTHGCCECLLTAMEGKFYKVAERILQKYASTLWKCAMGSKPCQFQHSFKKRMFNRKTKHMHEPQYIDYMLMLACSEEAPKNILQLLLQNGFKEFDADTVISLDDMDEMTRSNVEKIKDPFIQKIVYVTQLMAIQRKGRPDVHKLVRLIPKTMSVLEHIDHKLFKQPKRLDDIGPFIHMCCCLSMNGRCGYDIRMVNNKQQYVPVDLPEGLSLLHMVCALENVEHVKDLIKCGTDVDINMESTDGIRAVDVASACGNWSVFKFLLDQEAKVNSDTLLACCAQERHKGMHYWIDRLHAVHGMTPVLEKQRLKIAKELCGRHDTVNPLSYSQDTDECPLGAALHSKFWGVAEYLCTLTAGAAAIPMLQGINKDSKTEWALEAPKDLIRMIVEASVKHSASPISGKSSSPIAGLTHVLQTITKRSDFKLVESVVKQLDALMADDGKWLEMCRETDKHDMTILHYLSQIGHARAIETILKRLPTYTNRKDVINKYDRAEASTLWYALANKHWSTATLLLTFGANGDTVRAIPDFEPKRACSSEKQKIQDRDFKLKSESHKNGVRAFPIVRNDSVEVSLCFVPSSVFYTGKKEVIPETTNKPIQSNQITHILPATDPEKNAVKRLIRIAQAADAVGCDIIHAACGTGNTDLLREILRLQPNAFNQKDDQGYYPFAYAIIGGNQEVIDLLKENMTSEIAVNSLEPLIWKLASSEKGNKLRRAFSQLLGHICVNSEMCKEEEKDRMRLKKKLFPFRWGDFSDLCSIEKQTFEKCLREDGAEKDSIDQVMKYIDILRKMLLSRHPLDSFLYLNPQKDTDLSDECAKLLLTVLLTHMKDLDSGSILSLVMIQKSWILKELMESNVARDTLMTMKKQILWKYSIVDCLFIFANPEDERFYSEGGSQHKLDKHVKEMMNRYSLTLSPGIGTLAVHKNLWLFLEHALFQTFESEGSLSDEWHSILATGAERGQLPFLRSILDKLHIPRMTADQRSCFTAYLCLACMAGKTDVVKYLLRHNVPTVGSMDEYPIRDILGKHHKKTWNILHYVFYSKSESTLKEILSVLKTEREFLKNLQVDECIMQSGKTGRPGIVNQMVQFLSMTKNEVVRQRDWDKMLQKASSNGHEDLCIYLIEKQSANAITSDNSNMSPLHYCGYFGMEKLAAIIVERQPSALEKVDSRGLTPKDYANAMGQLRLLKGSKQTLKQQAAECDGWLRCLLQGNAFIQHNSTEVNISPHVFAQKRNLTLKNLLLRSDDHASENIIRWSSHEFVRMAVEEPQKCVEYFILAAFYKCNKALKALCDILHTSTDKTHNLQSLLLRDGHVRETSTSRNGDQDESRKLTSKRGNGLTPLGWAICSQNMEGVDILMGKETCLTWRDNFSLENILHLAVKTENVSIVNHVNDKTEGKLISEEDRQKVTPLAVAVALGLHRILRVLTRNKLKSISSSHEKHAGNRVDYGCTDCLLDHCIGWSKNYLNGDFEMTSSEEEEARIIFQKKNNRGYVSERLPFRSVFKVRKIPFSVRHLCVLNADEESYQLHKIHCISALGGPNSKLVKSALFSMGYKVNEEMLQWITLRSLTDPFEAAKKAVRAGYKGLAVKFIPQLNDEQALDIFETAAVDGKAYLVEQCQERFLSLITNTAVKTSIVESSVAFGQIALGIRLLRLIQTSGNTEQFDAFRDIIEAIPQKIRWLMEDQIPGNDQWLTDIEQGDRLTLPDLWLSMDETDPLRQYIEEKIKVDNLLPETFKGKKFVPDKESFRRYSYFKEKGDIWIRCFIVSSQIFGHVCDVLNIDDPKAATVNTVKVACLPPGSSDHPKMSVETNSVLTDSIAVTMHNEKPVLQHDPSMILRFKESLLKDVVQLEIIPAMEEKIMNEFGMPIRIRVDWNSIETRKRTTGSETIMKALTGDNFRNELGGLQDVLADCTAIIDTIKYLFNDETVQLALKPVAGIKYITVTFVDSISSNDGQKKSRIATPDSNVLWNFSMDRSALKYDRSTFPLFFHLNRYRTACLAFCDSIYRMSHRNPLALADDSVNWFEIRKKRSVTLEVEWSSFQSTDETAFMDLVGHGIARELQVMASETEAMLRLTINCDRVIVKNSASALYTGITIDTHGKTISASVYAHQTAKKTWAVEEGRTAAKLGDLEDKQLSNGSWQKSTHSMVEDHIAKTRKEVEKRFGFNIEILFDEKRIFVPLLLKCRREAEHPHNLIQRSMKEFLENLIVVYDKAMYELLSGIHASYSIFMQELDVHSGIWKDYTRRNGKNSKQTKGLVLRKYEISRKRNRIFSYKSVGLPIEDYMYVDNFKMQQVSQDEIEDQAVVSNSYEFMYPTSTLIDRSHTDNAQHVRFVSCNGRMYEIVDQNALMRALYKLTTKAVMGHEVLDILDLFGSERLFLKLFPTLVKDIQTSSKSTTIPLIYDSLYRINCLYGVRHIRNIVVNWDELFDSNITCPDDRVRKVQRIIGALEDAMEKAYRKESLPCNMMERNHEVSNKSLMKISSIHLTKVPDDFKPDASVLRIVQPKEKGQPHLHLRSGNELTVAYQNFKNIALFHDILLTAVVHVLEVEVKAHIERGIAKNPEKDKWRRKQYDGPKLIRPSLCYVERVLPRVLSSLSEIMNTTEGKECLLSHFFDFQFAKAESNRTTVELEEGWLICFLSPEDMGANIGQLLMSALCIKSNGSHSPVLHYKGPCLNFASNEENTLKVMATNGHGNLLRTMCDPQSFTIQLWTKDKEESKSVNPYQVVMDESQQAIKINWKRDDELPSNHMGHAQLMYRDVPVGSQINTYLCDKVGVLTEKLTDGGGLEIQKGGNVLVIVEHNPHCHVQSRHDKTATNQKTDDIQNGIQFVTKNCVDFLIKTRKRTFRQPRHPIKIRVLSGDRNAQCIKLLCLDKSRRVRLCARCNICGSMLRMVTPSVVIPPGKDLIVNQ